LEWKKQKLYISLLKQHSGITMLKGADVNRLKTFEMDSFVCGLCLGGLSISIQSHGRS
jgi:hypothetical protein